MIRCGVSRHECCYMLLLCHTGTTGSTFSSALFRRDSLRYRVLRLMPRCRAARRFPSVVSPYLSRANRICEYSISASGATSGLAMLSGESAAVRGVIVAGRSRIAARPCRTMFMTYSTVFLNSRTLPGQSYCMRNPRASEEKPWKSRRGRIFLNCSMKCSTSRGMSSTRSRKGGT